MSITVYYLGGSLDLTKQARPEDSPQRRLFAYKSPGLTYYPSPFSDGPVPVVREVYQLLGEMQYHRDTFVYEYAGEGHAGG